MMQQSQRLRRRRPRLTMIRPTPQSPERLSMQLLQKKVSGKKYSEQNVVDAATKAINDAIAALDLMTYNATFYADGAEYRVVPTRSARRSLLPKLLPRPAMSSPVGIPQSALWALRMFPSTLSSPRARFPTRLRLMSWVLTDSTAQQRPRLFPQPPAQRLRRA